jgi:hypothetical protein
MSLWSKITLAAAYTIFQTMTVCDISEEAVKWATKFERKLQFQLRLNEKKMTLLQVICPQNKLFMSIHAQKFNFLMPVHPVVLLNYDKIQIGDCKSCVWELEECAVPFIVFIIISSCRVCLFTKWTKQQADVLVKPIIAVKVDHVLWNL